MATAETASTHQPLTELPSLDVGDYLAGDKSRLEPLAEQLRYAASEIGFFTLKNSGIDEAKVERAATATRDFHALPMEAKLKLKIDQNQRGYVPPRATLVKHSTYNENTKFDSNETFVVSTELDEEKFGVSPGTHFYGHNRWPQEFPEFRPAIETYMNMMTALGKSLLPIYARALGLDEDFFAPHFENNYTYGRFAHYPPNPNAGENEFGLGPHADTGFMTLLPPANVQGLEILTSDGSWFRVPLLDDELHINIGMFLSRWTNDFFKATPHRVIANLEGDRYTIPCFVNTALTARMECLPTCTGPDNPAKYEPETYWEFFNWYMTNSYPQYEEFHKD
ncbi:MAG: hypothetical protein OEY85_00995 [Rhodospirillales bacterium]|nr:hypothetical protein [Rhodospirillales bacterium]